MLNTYHIEIVPPAPETLTLLLQVPRNRGAVNDCCCSLPHFATIQSLYRNRN